MISPGGQSVNYQLAQRLLDAATLRHEAIAANIANAETPGYRRIDVAGDFDSTLRARFASASAPSATELAAYRPQVAIDPSARSIRPDGNSFEIEHELMEMSRNRVEHEFLTEMIGGHIKQLRMAITGRVV
jgi:flagellar basal-body rod protein FlgB